MGKIIQLSDYRKEKTQKLNKEKLVSEFLNLAFGGTNTFYIQPTFQDSTPAERVETSLLYKFS